MEFTLEKLEELKVEYKKAADSGAESFELDGNVFDTRYAHCLISYLEEKL